MFVKPRRPVSKVFLHCTASDSPAHDNIATIRRWHVHDNGWSDVGYHYLLHKDGGHSLGRSLELTPAAQAGHNTGTIAICLHGLAKDKFTEAQFETLRKLVDEIDAAYDGKPSYHGHCEVAAKLCPVFDYRGVLGLDARGQPADYRPPAEGADADDLVLPTRVLRKTPTRTDRPEARILQNILNELGYGPLVVDGWFYNATDTAIRRFQTDHHLVPDGAVGTLTWEALGAALKSK